MIAQMGREYFRFADDKQLYNYAKTTSSSPSDSANMSTMESMRKGFEKRCKEDAVSALLFFIVHQHYSPDPVGDVLSGVIAALGEVDARFCIGDRFVDFYKPSKTE